MQNTCTRNNQTVKDPGQMSLCEGLQYKMCTEIKPESVHGA